MPYLIDGHNLVPKAGLSLADPDDEQKLIELLRVFLVRTGKKGTVIFDRGQPGVPTPRTRSGLEVRFARDRQSADSLIRQRLEQDRNPRGLTVVSDDHQVTNAARRVGATVVPSAEFARQLRAVPGPGKSRDFTLSPEEIAAWEAEFARRKKPKAGKSD